MKNKHQTMILSVLAVGLAVCGASARPVPKAPLGCGVVLTANTTLQNDLDCSGSAALVIGADHITVNLNGHTLRSLDGLGVGILIAGHKGVTVKNGVIDGFQEAIRAQEASHLTLRGLTIPSVSGNGIIPGSFGVVAAIHVSGGKGVRIQDSSIAAGPPIISEGVFGPDAITLQGVRDVSIKNVNVEGGFSGVNFGTCDEPSCPPYTEQLPSTGEVKDCTFANNFFGVVLVNAADITIKGNVISGANQGIRAGLLDVLPPANVSIVGNELFGNAIAIEAFLVPTVSEFPGPIFDCKIAGNQVHDNSEGGIQLVNGQNCRVTENLSENNARYGINLDEGCANNVVSENHVANNGRRGIVLTWDNYNNRISGNTVLDNGVEGISLFLGTNTGNQITDNIALGNGVWDLFQNDESTPNVWRDNTYSTKSGADIP